MMDVSNKDQCRHQSLVLNSSQHAEPVGYRPRTYDQLRIAAGLAKHRMLDDADFARPLILPDDDLAVDPKYPPQGFRSWKRLDVRNTVHQPRRILYVAAAPTATQEISTMQDWGLPQGTARRGTSSLRNLAPPSTQDVISYLAAFYHGLTVKELPGSKASFQFIEWNDSKSGRASAHKRSAGISSIGLANSTEAIRVRVRPCPDGAFSHQLNLNDILDLVISSLLADAYALLLLVNQDLYEDEDDDYCCGRAYGASGCAVVSTARYHPQWQRLKIGTLDGLHPWPASHCKDYIEATIGRQQATFAGARNAEFEDLGGMSSAPEIIDLDTFQSSVNSRSSDRSRSMSPLEEAILAYTESKGVSGGNSWLFDVCRTASHELGHCLGMDHCVYYACAMQGTASMTEDRRQPPYLCPVDMKKLHHAVNESGPAAEDTWTRERDNALLVACEKLAKAEQARCWTAFAAWLRARLRKDAPAISGS